MQDASHILTPASWLDPIPLESVFGRDAPLEVDVGCGKGRFLVTRATQFPEHNFLGIDRLLLRLRKVDGKIRRAGLTHVRLLRLEADYSIRYLLPPASVSTFYIFFPDPWPKRRHHRRRLLQEEFSETLLSVLKPGGCIHFATDHLDYFEHSYALLKAANGLREIETFVPGEEERTEFEQLFLAKGMTIGRCSFMKE